MAKRRKDAVLVTEVRDLFTSKYNARRSEVIIQLGAHSILRDDVARALDTVHIGPARNLGRLLKSMGVTTVAQLKEKSLDDFLLAGFGDAHLRVLLELLDYLNIDVRTWCRWNNPKAKPTSTFVSVKAATRRSR